MYSEPIPVEATPYDHDTQECFSCRRILLLNRFRNDTSTISGKNIQCEECLAAPRLSTREHVNRLEELNYSSEATRAQRWGRDQLDFMDSRPRVGKELHHSKFLQKLYNMVGPNGTKIYITEGNILGDLSIFKLLGRAPKGERDFEYLCYMPTGMLSEYSIIEFDKRDIPIKEERRGYRTVLLRLIKASVITEEQCRQEFGEAVGPASIPFNRDLYRWRNREASKF